MTSASSSYRYQYEFGASSRTRVTNAARVEDHRNKQRRGQQLDQPADQAAPSSQPPAV
ncbi:hypothetical protein [Streptomyces sp.]|uniref:hypothetical protein n=1 Tax=Streptomyces sp. TaxID=1931 RepID=UPI002F95B9F1